jgi:hypothetical protein
MKTNIGRWALIVTFVGGMTLLSACTKGDSSYSTLSSGQSFTQSNSGASNAKLDVLWVVDNSSSMDPLQANLTSNFASFIQGFQNKNFDFQMAVTTSDAYLADSNFDDDPTRAYFRDGLAGSVTGVFNMVPSTMNLSTVFVADATTGSAGSGDERVFSSFKETLNSSQNAGWLRSDSYFAIIMLSDEDDMSDPTRPEVSWQYVGGIPDHDYSNPGLETVASYEAYLDGLTGTTGATRRWSASAIAVLDGACLASHVGVSPATIIGQRMIQMAGDTNGVVGSICDASYSSTLLSIQNQIMELSTQFVLNRTPIVSTITVVVNGTNVVQDPVNGWTYVSAANAVQFHGSAIPAAGSQIAVDFQPQNLNF